MCVFRTGRLDKDSLNLVPAFGIVALSHCHVVPLFPDRVHLGFPCISCARSRDDRRELAGHSPISAVNAVNATNATHGRLATSDECDWVHVLGTVTPWLEYYPVQHGVPSSIIHRPLEKHGLRRLRSTST